MSLTLLNVALDSWACRSKRRAHLLLLHAQLSKAAFSRVGDITTGTDLYCEKASRPAYLFDVLLQLGISPELALSGRFNAFFSRACELYHDDLLECNRPDHYVRPLTCGEYLRGEHDGAVEVIDKQFPVGATREQGLARS